MSPSDLLENVGVAAGDTLNVVKGKRATRSPQRGTGDKEESSKESLEDSVFQKNSGFPDNLGAEGMEEKYRRALEDMDPEQLERAKKSMEAMLDSEVIEEYFNNDEKLVMLL